MTHRLITNYAKNYCNRTLIVKVIVENVVTCFFGDTVYKPNVVNARSYLQPLGIIANTSSKSPRCNLSNLQALQPASLVT